MSVMICKTELEEHTRKEILDLYRVCSIFDRTNGQIYLSTELNHDKTIPPFYLMYEQDRLIAFLILFMPQKREAEVTACTHPQYRGKGCFCRLCEKAKEICANRDIQKLVYAIDSESKAGQEVIKSRDRVSYSFSEYKMRWKLRQRYALDEEVSFQPVTAKNSAAYRKVAAEVLEMGDEVLVFLEAILPAKRRKGYLEYWHGIPVGVCHISYDDKEACIYGLGVLESFRGRGFGKQFIRYILNTEADKCKEIVIEVDSDNQRAYRLYLSCGFEVEYKTDYYEEEIEAGPCAAGLAEAAASIGEARFGS